MAVTVNSLPNKIDPNSDRQIDELYANNKGPVFPFYLLMMMSTTIGSFLRSYRRHDNDYSMSVFCLLVFSVFVLVDYCLVWYLALSKHEKSSWKFWLKVMMWFMYTCNSFGFVYLFSFFYGPQVTVALYAVMLVCSAVLLYAFLVADVLNDWKTRMSQSLDAGKSNYVYSVLEKV